MCGLISRKYCRSRSVLEIAACLLIPSSYMCASVLEHMYVAYFLLFRFCIMLWLFAANVYLCVVPAGGGLEVAI